MSYPWSISPGNSGKTCAYRVKPSGVETYPNKLDRLSDCNPVGKQNNMFTTRRQSLGHGNIFRSVCHSVHGEGGVCIQGGLHSGGLHTGGLHSEGSASSGVSAYGSLQSRGLGRPRPPKKNQKSGWYTSYCNSFLFNISFGITFSNDLTFPKKFKILKFKCPFDCTIVCPIHVLTLKIAAMFTLVLLTISPTKEEAEPFTF